MMKLQVGYPLCEMLETKSILDFRIFLCFGVWNTRIDIMRLPWQWDPRQNTKFVYVLYTPYKYSLKVIFYNVLE